MKVKATPIVLLALASSLTVGGIARAQDTPPSYTIEDVRACASEAMRLCKDKLPKLNAIEDCMRAHYDSLNPKCKARFKDR